METAHSREILLDFLFSCEIKYAKTERGIKATRKKRGGKQRLPGEPLDLFTLLNT